MFVSFAFYSATNIVFADVKDGKTNSDSDSNVWQCPLSSELINLIWSLEKLKAILTGYAVLLGTEIHRFTCQENT